MYIGITGRDVKERWGHNGKNYTTSPHFYSAIQKYGWDEFEHNILYENLTKNDACTKEQELIKKYNTMDNRYGYNMTTGGEIFTMSKEANLKKSIAMRGNKNGLGKPCSIEKRKKLRASNLGKTRSEETRRKQSEKAKLRHVPCSEAKREILRNNHPHMRKVFCEETQTIYKSVQECARQLNLQATLVSKVCRGKAKATGGYHLKYYDTINA